MWQSHVENENYSYHFLAAFNTLHGCISIPAPPRMFKLAMVDSCPIYRANIGPYLPKHCGYRATGMLPIIMFVF